MCVFATMTFFFAQWTWRLPGWVGAVHGGSTLLFGGARALWWRPFEKNLPVIPPASALLRTMCGCCMRWTPKRECVGRFLGRPGHGNARVKSDPGVFLYVAFFLGLCSRFYS